MAELTLAVDQRAADSAGLIWRIAWRNLWRNPRRTWLTAGGIAFATLLVSLGMTVQAGSYSAMIASATEFLDGHIQISHPRYAEEEKLEQLLPDGTALMRGLAAVPGIEAAPRVAAFALVSAGERSFGGLVMGVDFEAEQRVVNFFSGVSQGRLPVADDEVVIGQALARNLGVGLDDEIVVLGSANEGGVGAMALNISGIFDSGQSEIDRLMMFTHLPAVQNAFALGDGLHVIAIRTMALNRVAEDVARIQAVLPAGLDASVRPWQLVMRDVVEAIEFDRIGGRLMYGAVLVLVAFSVVSTFLMIVFERTREFGMLLAIGMRPGLIVRQVLYEASCLWLVGTGVGLLLVGVFVGYLAATGIPIDGMEELANSFFLDDRIYPEFTVGALATAPLVLLVGTQLAGLFATRRVRRIQPVTALRVE